MYGKNELKPKLQLNVTVPSDAHRALELLEEYHSRLNKAQDRPLRNAIERVIRIFKSRLFQALLGKSHQCLKYIVTEVSMLYWHLTV